MPRQKRGGLVARGSKRPRATTKRTVVPIRKTSLSAQRTSHNIEEPREGGRDPEDEDLLGAGSNEDWGLVDGDDNSVD